VEADVPGDDRYLQLPARGGQAPGRFRELPQDLRPLGIAEVEAIGEAERLAADARDVSSALGDGQPRAFEWVEEDEARVAIDGQGERAVGALDANHRCVAAAGPQNAS